MRPESAPSATPRELLVVCKSGCGDPKYAYVSILEGFCRVFGKLLLKGLFNGDPHLSREHFQVAFVNGRIFVTNLSTNNSTLIRDTSGQKLELRHGTRELVEVQLKATIQAGRSFFRVEEIISGQQILPQSDFIQPPRHRSSNFAQPSPVNDSAAPAPNLAPVPPPVVATPAVVVSSPVTMPQPVVPAEMTDLRKETPVADGKPKRAPSQVQANVPAKQAESSVPDSRKVAKSPSTANPDSAHPLQPVPQRPMEEEPANDPSTSMFDSGDFGFSLEDDKDFR